MTTRPLRYAMIGGGPGAFIGAVHRAAARLDDSARLVAGCFSASAEKSSSMGAELALDPARTHPTWHALLDDELARPPHDRIEFVSIVSPNHTHAPIASAFLSAGLPVLCDKPLTRSLDEARALAQLCASARVPLGVTYNYSGYPLVKHARHLVRSGALGAVRKVIVEYNQGWLSDAIERSGHKQASWRTTPALAGAGALGDIATHAEQLLSYVTGLEIESLCADTTTFVEGRQVEDDASLLLRFVPHDSVQARGVLTASQTLVGSENALSLRIHATLASLEWHQEQPNALHLRAKDRPEQILRRGDPSLCPEALAATRLPPGHPEAFLEAFANIYRNFSAALHHGATGPDAAERYDFPGISDGLRGVHFVHSALASAASPHKWTPAKLPSP